MLSSLSDKIQKLKSLPFREIPPKIYRYSRHFIFPYPDNIILQTVSLCNMRCPHCFLNEYGTIIPDGKKKLLKYEEFEEMVQLITPAIKKAKQFQFSTFEPFLHKDLFKMMDLILSINPETKFPFITNGKAIKQETLDKLSHYPLAEFLVSLDGINKKQVESFKLGSNFEHTVEVIKKAVNSDLNVPVGTVLVLYKDNVNDLVEYIDYVADLGIKLIYINNLLAFTEKHADYYLYKPGGNPEVETIFRKAVEKAKDRNVKIFLPSMKPKPRGCTTCENLIIDWNGNVVPCDFLAVESPFELFGETKTSKPVIFGNIFKDDALQIYRSKDYTVFRNRHRAASNIPEECSHCIDAYGLMCSHRE